MRLAPILRWCGWMILAGVVTIVVTYPAIVAYPSRQWDALLSQLSDATSDRRVFFLGRYAAHPSVEFYPVTLAYAVSAWFFVLAPIGVVVALIRRASRIHAVTILAWTVVPAASLLVSGLAYPRYGLVVLGPLTLAAATALHAKTPARAWWKDRINQAAAGATAAMLTMAILVAPWGGLTFNPIMSAYRKPILVQQLGWGEASAVGIGVVEQDARKLGLDCDQLSVSGLSHPPVPGGCRPRRVGSAEADYTIVAAASRQRFAWTKRNLPAEFDLIDVVYLNGQRIVEVWRSQDLGAAAAGAGTQGR